MQFLRRVFPSCLLILLFAFSTSEALAKRPINNPGNGNDNGDSTDSSCLGNKQLTLLAKEALLDLQTIDPTVTLTDVKAVIKSVGDCVTTDAVVLVLDDYQAELCATVLPAAGCTGTEPPPVVENTPPTIYGSPSATVAEGIAYQFIASASDGDGDSLSFTISGKPHWANFNAASGTLSGSPGYMDAGTYSQIVISVSDGTDLAALSAFSIVVTNTNRAPSINGTPASIVTEGDAYSFIPIATDPDSDAVTFTAINLPSWASFNTSNGEVSGIPDAADVGIYDGIIIMVSDGSDAASLGGFSITVDAAIVVTGKADLAWEIPTTRTDGSALTLSEINGYRIYMGPTSDDMQLVVDLNDGSETSYSLTDLPAGTYHFAVTTYDLDGYESAYSNVAIKAIL